MSEALKVVEQQDWKIFEQDETNKIPFNPNWTVDELLDQTAVFFLKDVVKILGIDPVKIKKIARNLQAQGRSPYGVLGVRKLWSHWIVRMKVFAPYYRANLTPKTRPVDPRWDGNTLLAQKGRFLLTEVAPLIPFSTHQIRYQAKKNPRARKTMGVWKDDTLDLYIVNMERFAAYVREIWTRDL